MNIFKQIDYSVSILIYKIEKLCRKYLGKRPYNPIWEAISNSKTLHSLIRLFT